MESTGKYWAPVFNILEERDIRVTIANPKWVKAVKENKDDTRDSKWIDDLFRLGLVPGSFIPSNDIRILREFTRYRYKLVSMKSNEKNRFQNAFTICDIALDSVVSDMFGKSATAITDYFISENIFDPDHCVSLLQRSLKKKADYVLELIEKYSITDAQKFRMRIVCSHLHYIKILILQVDSAIDTMVAKHEPLISQLCTIPVLTVILQSRSSPRSALIYRRLVPLNACAAGQVPRLATMNPPVRKSTLALHEYELISTLCWCKSFTQP